MATAHKTKAQKAPRTPKARASAPAADSSNAPHAGATAEMAAELGEMWQTAAGLKIPLAALSTLQADYLKQATELWNSSLHLTEPAAPQPVLKDRRFAAPAWSANPASSFVAQLYLLNAKTLQAIADQVEGEEKSRQRIRFAVQQFVDAASPSNFLALNAEAQALALETKGESLSKGLQQLWGDVQRGHVSQTDESAFEVGRNVATSEGSIVFENPFFQLIEYKPLTAQVFERPLLMVPPCINKFSGCRSRM